MNSREEGKRLFDYALDLYKKGKYQDAADNYIEASRKYGNPAIKDMRKAAQCIYNATVAYKRLSDYENMYKWSSKALKVYNSAGAEKINYNSIAGMMTNIAYAAIYLGKFKVASEAYLKAINLYRNLKSFSNMCDCYGFYSYVMLKSGNYKQAVTYATTAIQKLPTDMRKYQESLGYAYMTMSIIATLKKSQKARPYADKALALFNSYNGKESHNSLREKFYIANIYKSQNKFKEASHIYDQIENGLVLYKDFDTLLCLYQNLATCNSKLGRDDLAIANYNQVIRYKDKVSDSRRGIVLRATYAIADIYTKNKRTQQAINYYEQVGSMLKKYYPKNTAELSKLSIKMGVCYKNNEQYGTAISYLNAGLKYCTGLKERLIGLSALNTAYYNSANYIKCIEIDRMREDILLKNNGQKSEEMANVYWDLSRVYEKTNQVATSNYYLEKLLDIHVRYGVFKRLKKEVLYRRLYLQYGKANNMAKAVNYATKYLDCLDTKTPKGIEEAVSIYSNLGAWYQQAGEYDNAMRFFEKAMSYNKNIPAANKYMKQCLSHLAKNYMSGRRYRDAIDTNNKLIELIKSDKASLMLAEAYYGNATAYDALNNSNESFQNYYRAVETYEMAGEINCMNYARACHALGDRYVNSTEPKKANMFYVMARGAYLQNHENSLAQKMQNIIDKNYYCTMR